MATLIIFLHLIPHQPVSADYTPWHGPTFYDSSCETMCDYVVQFNGYNFTAKYNIRGDHTAPDYFPMNITSMTLDVDRNALVINTSVFDPPANFWLEVPQSLINATLPDVPRANFTVLQVFGNGDEQVIPFGDITFHIHGDHECAGRGYRCFNIHYPEAGNYSTFLFGNVVAPEFGISTAGLGMLPVIAGAVVTVIFINRFRGLPH